MENPDFMEKRHGLVLYQGTEIKCMFSKTQDKDVANMQTSAGGWDTVQFVVMHTTLCLKA